MKTLEVKITFTEEILGTLPSQQDIHREYIASKSPDAMTIEAEVAAIGVDEVVEKGITVFPRNKFGIPFLYDYQIKGFFKGACGMLNRVGGKDENGKKLKTANESAKITAFKKVIDGLIFVSPREIPLIVPDGFSVGDCQRPLRAQTARGERVALANSETCPAGTMIEFSVQLLSDEYESAVHEWLDYGALSGIGQWRNSGKGRFVWEEIQY
jgi:hypothetical protein